MPMPYKACLMFQGKPNCIGQKFEVALDEWADIGARQCTCMMTGTRVHLVGRGYNNEAAGSIHTWMGRE